MFILKTSLSLLLFFVFIIYFTIRKVNPLCEKIIYTRKKVGGRPTSPAESRTSLSGLYTFTPSGHEIRHKRLTRFCASQGSFKTGSLLIPGNPGRIGSRSFPTNHEQRTTKKHWNFPVLFYKNQRLPILPGGLPPSTFGVCGLNCCVRHGNRWIPAAIATELYCSGCSYPDNCIKMFFLTNSLLVSESSFSLCICFQFHSFLRFGVSDSLSFARRLRLLQNWFSA